MIVTLTLHALVALVVSAGLLSVMHATRVSKDNGSTNLTNRERLSNAPERDSFIEASTPQKKKARIRCSRISPAVLSRFSVVGYNECGTLSLFFGGNMGCQNGCLGLGSCAHSCPVDAIVLRNGVIGITDRCTGCGLCVRECPKGLIEIVPRNEEGTYACAADKHLVTERICPTASGNFWLNSSFYKDSDFKRR